MAERILRHLPMMYEALDDAVSTQNDQLAAAGTPVSCSKSCAGCCYLLVSVTFAEAFVIVTELQSTGRLLDFIEDKGAEMRHLAEDVLVTPGQTRGSYLRDRHPCLFLAPNKTCSVYEHRPLLCRLHAVIDDPILCDDPNSTLQSPDRSEWRNAAWLSITKLLREDHSQLPDVSLPLPVAIQWATSWILEGRESLVSKLRNHPGSFFDSEGSITAKSVQACLMFWAKLETVDGRTYEVKGDTIECRICGNVSSNPNDVREKFCGRCRVFHDGADR